LAADTAGEGAWDDSSAGVWDDVSGVASADAWDDVSGVASAGVWDDASGVASATSFGACFDRWRISLRARDAASFGSSVVLKALHVMLEKSRS